MFSSTINNVNLFPHFSITSCNPSPTHESINNTEHNNGIFLYNHNQIPLTIPFLSSNSHNNTPLISELPMFNNSQASSNHFALSHDNAVDFLQEKRPARKDRHSKIHTAQGLRDRRVRLSIEISRKFFDLQDLLGFDRASKTLEWLLDKSRKAIKELTAENGINLSPNNKQSLSSSNLTCEQIDQDPVASKRVKLNCVSSSHERKIKKLEKLSVLAKESRAKARARARERTRIKMSIRKLYDQSRVSCSVSTLFPIFNHSRSAHLKIGSCGGVENEPHTSYAIYQALREDNYFNEESTGTKRKLKPHSLMGYQQNLVASYNNNQPQNVAHNWDILNPVPRSNFRAINPSSGPQVQVLRKY